MDQCNADVFKNGQTICAVDGRSAPVEEWVKRVAAESGQAVDWHYSGGVANVLYVGDYERVLAAVETLQRSSDVRIMRMYEPTEKGLYRAGDALPEGTIAVDTVSAVLGIHDGPIVRG